MKSVPGETAEEVQPPPRPGGCQVALRRCYLGLAVFFTCCVVVQVFFAGAGLMAGAAWGMMAHVIFGSTIILLPLFLIPLGLFGRLPKSVNWLTALLVVLTLLQYLLPFVPRKLGIALVSALHPVNALLLFVLPLFLSYRVWRAIKSE